MTQLLTYLATILLAAFAILTSLSIAAAVVTQQIKPLTPQTSLHTPPRTPLAGF